MTAQEIGIYEIYNKITHQIYIGSSQDIKSRINNHKSKLNKNKHPNKFLQNSYNKYKKENFEFNTIVTCSLNELEFYEDKLINLQFSNIKQFGYNLREVCNSMRGYKHTEETKLKAIKNKKKTKHTEETKKLMSLRALERDKRPFKSRKRNINATSSCCKQVKITNLVTKDFLVFKSHTEASKYFNCKRTSIGEAIKHNRVFNKVHKIENYAS